jgi:sporulation protein YlmC with PRC-barrel domain
MITTPHTPPPGSTELARRETRTLIAADRVEGTSVYDRAGNKLGSIDSVMLDKHSGRVAYAVLSFGGFLGFGESHFPLPWEQLKYDTRNDGYVVDITEERLKGAPQFDSGSAVDWTDDAWVGRIDEYYGASRPMMHDAQGGVVPRG